MIDESVTDFSTLSDEQFTAQLAELVELAQRERQENQLLHYTPVSQTAMAIHESKARVLGIGGGNGSGKSELAIMEVVMAATGVFPESLKHLAAQKFRGPVNCRIIVQSLTTTLYNIILPKLQHWKWSGIDAPGGDRGHWGWIPKWSLIGSSWERSWHDKLRTLRCVCRDPDDINRVVGESTIQFMCLRGDQRVLMSDGQWKAIERIVPGDRVWVPESGAIPVNHVVRYEDAPMLRIKCDGGREIVSTPNHRHLMKSGEWCEAGAIMVGNEIAVFDEQMPGGIPSEKWALGWTAIMIGDGYLGGSQASFAAKAPSRVLDDLPELPPACKVYDTRRGFEWRVTLEGKRRDNPLVMLLKECGLWKTRSATKFIPPFVFKADQEGRAYFLKHLWHTDGTIYEPGRQATYRTISRRLAYDVKYLLWSLGVIASINEANGICGFTGKLIHSYGVVVSGGSFDRASAIFEGRPFSNIAASTRRTIGKVKAIEDAGTGEVFCIEVADHRHSFVCDGLITHNSHDQESSDAASGDFHIIMLDEIPKLAMWRETEARTMRVAGRIILSMTWSDDPAIPVDWIFDEVYDKAADKVDGFEWHNIYTTDNPNLDQRAVAAQASAWSIETRNVRLFGQPIRFSNRIHPVFTDQTQHWCFTCGKTTFAMENREAVTSLDRWRCDACGSIQVAEFNHVREFSATDKWPCVFVIDPHPRKPHMYLWTLVDPSDDLWVVADGACAGDPVEARKDTLAIERTLGLNVCHRIMDPNMALSSSS